MSEEGQTHHFATATIQQLKETKFYADTVIRSKEYLLEHLYIAVNIRGQSKESVKLVSIPKELMLVLLDTYLSRPSRSPPLPSASDIIPSCSVGVPNSFFCLVRNPNYQPNVEVEDGDDDTTAYSFLFQFEQDSEIDSRPASSSQKSKNQWDGTILWNFCRWRSCMAPATSSPAPRYLCTHHSLLKNLLESTTKKKNESARFLPRKPPTFPDAVDATNNDLKMIKAASSLVEELAEDKLAGTIDSFCHRVSSEHGLMRQKHCSRFNPVTESSTEPTWKRWGDPGMLERTLREMEYNQRAASSCLDLESATTGEIQGLSAYPVSEVALMIQKELQRNIDLFDVNSSQRKFELIRSLIHHATNP